MSRFAKYALLLIALSLCCSCASNRPFGRKKKPTTYYPNQRKKPSGMTDNCNCAKGGRNRSNVKIKPLNGAR